MPLIIFFGHSERSNYFSYILFYHLGVNKGPNFDCVIILSNLDEMLLRFAGEYIVWRFPRYIDVKPIKAGEAIAYCDDVSLFHIDWHGCSPFKLVI